MGPQAFAGVGPREPTRNADRAGPGSARTDLRRFTNLLRNLLHRDRVRRDLDDEVGTALRPAREREGAERPRSAGGAPRRGDRIRPGRSRRRRDPRREGRRGARRVGAGLPPGVPAAAAQSGVHGVRGGLARAGHRRGRRDLPAVRRGRAAEAAGARARSRWWSRRSAGRTAGSTTRCRIPHFEEIRPRNTTLAGIFATNPFGRVNVDLPRRARHREGIYVSGDYYTTLRLTPAAGRLIAAGDDRPGAEAAVLSSPLLAAAVRRAGPTSSARR